MVVRGGGSSRLNLSQAYISLFVFFFIISIHTQSIYLCLFNKEISYQKRKRHEFRQNLSQLAGLRREYQDFNRVLTKDWHISTFVSKQHSLEFDKKLSECRKFLAEPTLDKSLRKQFFSNITSLLQRLNDRLVENKSRCKRNSYLQNAW